MNKVIIREATTGDLSSLTVLLGQLGYTLEPEERERKMRVFLGDGYRVLVLEVDGHLAAFIALHIFESFHLPGRTGRITSFCVDEKHRAKGIGSELLVSAQQFLKEHQCRRIEVTSNDRRKDAHQFYVRHGFSAGSTKFVKDI